MGYSAITRSASANAATKLSAVPTPKRSKISVTISSSSLSASLR